MFRAYEYVDKKYEEIHFQSKLFEEKEKYIIKNFALNHPYNGGSILMCPACGKPNGRFFFTKWGIDYCRCPECKSIFALCEPAAVEAYRENKELTDLRCGENYQKEALKLREDAWGEFIFWLSVRTFRYLRKRTGLSIMDCGNRYRGLACMLEESGLSGKYILKDSILEKKDFKDAVLSEGSGGEKESADLILFLDQMQQLTEPKEKILKIKAGLRKGGLLVLSSRAGSGFDIITLRDKNDKIFPYEHVFLPSLKGMEQLLEETGFRVLEVTTPGEMDLNSVMRVRDSLSDEDLFIKDLIEDAEPMVLQEFQRFLQKSGRSSYFRIIARKE